MYVTAVALVLAVAAPAHASGGANKGPVGVGVVGDGLEVREVRAVLTGWYPGARAESFVVRGGKRIQTLGGWKAASSEQIAQSKFEIVSWPMRRTLRHGDRICARFEHRAERPCVTVQR
ncbi:hypothetical protein [Streptomyces sp. NBC_00454]|uniref:hypothetical protein n=1 Tax=Streptomyces sp. NBC_00454 TaxID=2975747 RepID=UPI0030E2D15F